MGVGLIVANDRRSTDIQINRMEEKSYNKRDMSENDTTFTLRDMVGMVQANWYWFVLSVALCLAAAFFYLKVTPKIYTRTATILIKDENKGGAFSESAAFEELGMFNVKSNVDNEILILNSKRLMREVVRQLKLDITYMLESGMCPVDLYDKSPVEVLFKDDQGDMTATFALTLLPDRKALLSGFPGEDQPGQTVALNDTVLTPVGKLVVVPTLYCSDAWAGQTLTIRKSKEEQVASAYKNRISVSLINKQSSSVAITLEDVCVRRSEDIINTLINIYNEDALYDRNQIARNTSKFIGERISIISRELGDVDSQIEQFKKENRITDITSETGIYLQTSSDYKNEGISVENQINLVRFVREYLMDESKAGDLLPANTGITDASISTAIAEYNDLLLKRDKLRSHSSSRNPVIQNLNNSLAAMKKSVVSSIDNLLVSLDIRMKNIRTQEKQSMQRIASVPSQERAVLSIGRQQKIKEELYLYLLNKREENELSLAMNENSTRIIDLAYGTGRPVAPKTSAILLTALMIGGLLPAILIYVTLLLNTKVRNRKDIENVVSAPFLGEIPQCTMTGNDEVVVAENRRDATSEAFRILRTNVDFIRAGNPGQKVMMITSMHPFSGKTFTSVNLAMSFALISKKVVLLDLDLRKRTLSRYVKEYRNGISTFLSGQETDVDKIIAKGVLNPNLDMIPAGPLPPNPVELLLSDNLDRLMSELRKRYDYIVIDSVPSTIVADTAVLNRVLDMTIYVIRQGILDRRLLVDVERFYRERKFVNMSVLLNGVKYKQSAYGYGYDYGNGYGYYYGREDGKKEKRRFRWWSNRKK